MISGVHTVRHRFTVICGLYWLLVRDEHVTCDVVSFVDLHFNYCRLTRLLGPDRTAETLVVTGDSTGNNVHLSSYLITHICSLSSLL